MATSNQVSTRKSKSDHEHSFILTCSASVGGDDEYAYLSNFVY